jgi:hypothetical protein
MTETPYELARRIADDPDAASPADKLRSIADWIDMADARLGNVGTEAQDFLREFANSYQESVRQAEEAIYRDNYVFTNEAWGREVAKQVERERRAEWEGEKRGVKAKRKASYKRGRAEGQRVALVKAQEIVRGFTAPDNGMDVCDKFPNCDLCVVGPLIIAALEDEKEKW